MVLLLLWLVTTALGSDCDPVALEEGAYAGRLTAEDHACLEERLSEGTPEQRAQTSFLLIIDASVARRQEEAGMLMQRHLSTFHTRDPEVAYLYANWLKDQGFQNAEEIVRWAKVALDGRFRWLNKRQNYTTMVKTLYDMLNEAAMMSAIQAEQVHRTESSDETKQVLDFRRRRARYWLIVSAPCLHDNQCEPRFEVEVEGAATCDDMLDMEDKASKAQLIDDERACLRARYRRTNKSKIIDILVMDAHKDRSGHRWNYLLAWHFDLSGSDDATLTAGAASFLARTGSTEEALRYADLALSSVGDIRASKGTVFQLHQLRLDLAKKLQVAADTAAAVENAPPETFVDAQSAKGRVRSYEIELRRYCTTTRECPRGWDK